MNRKGAAGLIIGIAVVAGCSALTSFEGYTSTDFKPGCELLRWPERPSNTGPEGTQSLIGATRYLRFSDPDAGTTPGLDLDGLCTCPDRGACVSKEGNRGPCDDGKHGVDNRGAVLLAGLFRNDADIQTAIARGLHGMLVRVDNYNGLPNDSAVLVSLYNVVGVNGKIDGTGSARFDGNDQFIIDYNSTVSDGQMESRYLDTAAYVAGGVLVAKFEFPLRLVIPPADNSPPVEIIEPFKSVQFVGRIESTAGNGGGLRISKAALAGLIPLKTMFLQAGPASVCFDAGPNPPFPQVKQAVCNSLDLPTTLGADPNAKCDALSLGIELDIVPAKLQDGARNAPSSAPPCPPTDIVCD